MREVAGSGVYEWRNCNRCGLAIVYDRIRNVWVHAGTGLKECEHADAR